MKKYFKRLCLIALIIGSMFLMIVPGIAKQQEEAAQDRVIYLTFDDGPSEYTDQLLDILDEHGMKATFFLLETEMKRYPEAVKRMIREGHGIGVHGVSHEKNTFYAGTMGPVKEMDQANATLESITGSRTYLARTPYGSSPYLTARQESELTNHQYILWDWNIDSRDWCYRNAQKTFYSTIKMIEKTEKEPKVILFHDIKQATETMQMMTRWMEERHYTSKAITNELQPVKLYRKKS